jgi:hypothetical protein
MDDDGGDVDIVNITFGEITDSSSQDHVTGTIRTSLELLQAQTQNILNTMTEYKAELQQTLQQQLTVGISQAEYDALFNKIDVVTNIIDYENQIKSAQQNRNTVTGRTSMKSSYDAITGEIAKLLSGQTNKDLLVAKTSTYQGAVELDKRNVINSAQRTTALDDINAGRRRITTLEEQNGNYSYVLPSPETNMYSLIGQLENENKQKLSDSNVLGQYGQYILYQGQDISEYSALLSDAAMAGKTVTLQQ